MTEKFTPRKIRGLLRDAACEVYRITTKRYFKSSIDNIGTRMPVVRKIAREAVKWCRHNGGFPSALKLAKPLWKKGKFEEKTIACFLLGAFVDDFDDSTWELCDNWVNDLNDWACCDYLSGNIISPLLNGRSDRRRELLKWTKSKNRWRRRAAAVSLVEHARVGNYLSDVWRIAAPLMPDKDDMARKGVAWLLREAARTAPDKVVNFCKKHEHHAARLILRTATETMPEKWKTELLYK